MTATAPRFVYKIASRHVYEASRAAGRFTGMPVDRADGYVHFSTAAQLAETLRLHFAGEGDLVLFAVPVAPLGEALRWEPSRGGQLFPHLYGELSMQLTGEHMAISVATNGHVALPDWVR
jgi:uncharacterized protein (DUF952 family)